MPKLKEIIKQEWPKWISSTSCITLLTLDYFDIYHNNKLLAISFVSLSISYYYSTKILDKRRKLEGRELSFQDIFMAGAVSAGFIFMGLQSLFY